MPLFLIALMKLCPSPVAPIQAEKKMSASEERAIAAEERRAERREAHEARKAEKAAKAAAAQQEMASNFGGMGFGEFPPAFDPGMNLTTTWQWLPAWDLAVGSVVPAWDLEAASAVSDSINPQNVFSKTISSRTWSFFIAITYVHSELKELKRICISKLCSMNFSKVFEISCNKVKVLCVN